MVMLNNEQIADFARAWYGKLDVHAPTQELLDMLNPNALKMAFPESSFEGVDRFIGWYEGVIRIFFDEEHRVSGVEVGRP